MSSDHYYIILKYIYSILVNQTLFQIVIEQAFFKHYSLIRFNKPHQASPSLIKDNICILLCDRVFLYNCRSRYMPTQEGIFACTSTEWEDTNLENFITELMHVKVFWMSGLVWHTHPSLHIRHIDTNGLHYEILMMVLLTLSTHCSVLLRLQSYKHL